jgi:hypothetical protein
MEEKQRANGRISSGLGLILVLGSCAWLIVREIRLKRPQQLHTTLAGTVDMCLSCHGDLKLDEAHDPTVIGCAPCHLGDPLAVTEKAAHRGMVLNPGDLRHVEKTCAVEGCHPKDAHKVKNSLMATNRGILGTLLYYWGESESQDTSLTVEELLASGKTSNTGLFPQTLPPVISGNRRTIAHRAAFFNEKGGGCSACHFLQPPGRRSRISVLPATIGKNPPSRPIRPKRRSIRWSRPPSRAPTASGAIIDPGVSACRISVCMNRKATAPPTRRAE